MEVATHLLTQQRGLRGLASMDLGLLAKEHGVGQAKATTIAAAFELGRRLLADWARTQSLFVKVMPRDYKRVLTAQARAAAAGREATFTELVGAANG